MPKLPMISQSNWTGKKTMTRKIFGTLLIGALLVSTAACNTVRGVGDDLKSAADAVDEAT